MHRTDLGTYCYLTSGYILVTSFVVDICFLNSHLSFLTYKIKYVSDCTIHIAGQDLFPFHDPPHLLKGVRNNFLTKDIMYEGKKASWSDILYIYDLDSKGGHTKAMPKLTAQHVNPQQINKMKVKTAAQVLSARTAAMLNYTHALRKCIFTSFVCDN